MKKPGKTRKFSRNEMIYGYLFIAPFYLLFMVFQLYPMLWSFVLSFSEWDGLGEAVFTGWENYKDVLLDDLFHISVRNTALYLAANLFFILPLAVLIGQMLCSPNMIFRRLFKTVVMLPYITSTVAAGLIFSMLFNTRMGVINNVLQAWGIPAVPWLNSLEWSKVPVILLSLWRNTPWYILIIMSAMLGVDTQLYESARMDGANSLKRLIHITIPMVSPVLFFAMINLTIDSARTFTEPYILTGGGPGSSSMSVVQYLYETAFTHFKLGYASTIGYMLTFILVIVSVLYFRVLRRQSEV